MKTKFKNILEIKSRKEEIQEPEFQYSTYLDLETRIENQISFQNSIKDSMNNG